MDTCPNGHAVSVDDSFCSECGAGVAMPPAASGVAVADAPRCPNGHPVAGDDVFCSECGAPVAPAAAPVAPEPAAVTTPLAAAPVAAEAIAAPVTVAAPAEAPTEPVVPVVAAPGFGAEPAWGRNADTTQVATPPAGGAASGGDVAGGATAPYATDEPETRRRGWVYVLAGVVVALLIGGGVAFALTRSDGSKAKTAAPPKAPASTTRSTFPTITEREATTSSTSESGEGVANSIDQILTESASARDSVRSVTAGVEDCSMPISSATQTMASIISSRQSTLSQIEELEVDQLPNGQAIVNALAQAANDSLRADQDFSAWIADVASTGCTPGTGSNDPNFQEGNTASTAASNDKTAFVALWNPVAGQYGLRQWQPDGF